MPSYFESLSMVALEAWALGKPVLANGRCDVLHGQCIRSNGGLYYENFAEFVETLRAIDVAAGAGRRARPQRPALLRAALHLADHRAASTSTCSQRLSREPEPTRRDDGAAAGMVARRRQTLLAPAREVLAAAADGPGRLDACRRAARPVEDRRLGDQPGARTPSGGQPPAPAATSRPRAARTTRSQPTDAPAERPASSGPRRRSGRPASPRSPAPRGIAAIAAAVAAERTGRRRLGRRPRAAGRARTAAPRGRAPAARRQAEALSRCRRGPSGARHARLRRRHRPRGRSASSACCARPATSRRSSSRPRIRRLEDLTRRLPRSAGGQPSRQHPDPPLLDRIARVAHRLRAARSDGARLPQHHAARVLRRRAPAAGAAVLSRPPRAGVLRDRGRPGARRLGVQPRRSSRRSGFPRTGVLPVVPGLLAPVRAGQTACRPARSTTTG